MRMQQNTWVKRSLQGYQKRLKEFCDRLEAENQHHEILIDKKEIEKKEREKLEKFNKSKMAETIKN